MKKHNDADIPRPIFNAMIADTYTGGKADFSVTGLFESARYHWGMKQLRQSDVSLPVSDDSIAFLGTVIHTGVEAILKNEDWIADELVSIMEMKSTDAERLKLITSMWRRLETIRTNNTFKTETRLNVTVTAKDGYKYSLSGEFDLYDKKEDAIIDHKTTISGGWNMRHKKEKKWILQLNIYRKLFDIHYGHAPKHLYVIGWITDWRKNRIMSDPLYPRSMFPVHDVPLMDPNEVRDYIQLRINDIIQYKDVDIKDMPYCSEENRWQNETTWKIIKLNKDGTDPAKPRAVPGGVFTEDEEGAKAFLATKGSGYRIKQYKSDPTRCIDYCPLSQLGLCDFPTIYKTMTELIDECKEVDRVEP